jgi:hypothetical protein
MPTRSDATMRERRRVRRRAERWLRDIDGSISVEVLCVGLDEHGMTGDA